MAEKMKMIESTILDEYNATVEFLYSTSFNYDSDDILQEIHETVGSAGIYIDQQVAACAPIGFEGTDKSTFSQLIQYIRETPGSCDTT